jgi:hypothetical protein
LRIGFHISHERRGSIHDVNDTLNDLIIDLNSTPYKFQIESLEMTIDEEEDE